MGIGLGGISDEVLLKRVSAISNQAVVAAVAQEIAEARVLGDDAAVAGIDGRSTCRMHDLSEFIKTLPQCFTRWFNRTHQRSGTLWEQRYQSVIIGLGCHLP